MNEVQARELFTYEHLPSHLQAVSQPYHDLAVLTCSMVLASAERTLALRKLWEAKNYAVWCAAQQAK